MSRPIYEVRQLVKTVRVSRLETIASTEFERVATQEYERLKAGHPAEYFELVRVTHDEQCLDFTPIKEEPK